MSGQRVQGAEKRTLSSATRTGVHAPVETTMGYSAQEVVGILDSARALLAEASSAQEAAETLLASAMEGWLYWLGRIEWTNFRIPVLAAGIVLLFPGLYSDLIGAAIVGTVYVVGLLVLKPKAA